MTHWQWATACTDLVAGTLPLSQSPGRRPCCKWTVRILGRSRFHRQWRPEPVRQEKRRRLKDGEWADVKFICFKQTIQTKRSYFLLALIKLFLAFSIIDNAAVFIYGWFSFHRLVRMLASIRLLVFWMLVVPGWDWRSPGHSSCTRRARQRNKIINRSTQVKKKSWLPKNSHIQTPHLPFDSSTGVCVCVLISAVAVTALTQPHMLSVV